MAIEASAKCAWLHILSDERNLRVQYVYIIFWNINTYYKQILYKVKAIECIDQLSQPEIAPSTICSLW